MLTTRLLIPVFLGFWGMSIPNLQAQSGDQILDGIGETGLIARYIFDGNAKDWSRNNLHGEISGSASTIIHDDQFGEVLSLPGDNDAFVTIPGEAVHGVASLTLSAWIYPRSRKGGQRFFDLGGKDGTKFYVAPLGTTANERCITQIVTEKNKEYSVDVEVLEVDKWSHLALVLDAPAKTMRVFINGVLAGKQNNAELALEELFDNNGGQNELLYVGKSLLTENHPLNAKLHDFRIYRIPLTEKQIAIIYHNALNDEDAVVGIRIEPEADLQAFTKNTPQLYNHYLASVPDIAVATTVGHLPRLPRQLRGVFKEGVKGPAVRVLWPAPKDNGETLEAGQYVVTGRIAGTDLKPKAFITVKEAAASIPPQRKLEVFALDQVSLRPDRENHSTKFTENRDKFINTLSATNPDDFLFMFRNAFGQDQPEGAKSLGGWDTQETKLRGHATGHYLSAIAQAYASTSYDESLHHDFGAKMNYLVNTLYELSRMSGRAQQAEGPFVSSPAAVPPGPGKGDYDSDLSAAGIRTDYWNWGKGFISAYPPDQFIMLEKGATYGTDDTKVWAPYYTLHKILAGLLDVYDVSGNEKALEVAKGMGEWVFTRLKKVPAETRVNMWNTYIAGEFGGMNETMARLYRMTNEQHYLKVAQLFDNQKVFYGDAMHAHGLAKNVDSFRGLHANQHIPQIIGALEMYRDAGIPAYYRIADNFWNKVINDYTYSIGGVAGASNPANAECFTAQPGTIYQNGLSAGGQNETCATYNLLKLTKNLFLFDQRGELMDYYERSLYNHILASVAADSPANTYHVPLRPGSVKHFSNANMDGFTCCNGTALESSTKLQNSIYFKSIDNEALYVNLYVPSTLNWTEKKVIVEQTTTFPKEDRTRLTIRGKGKFDLNVRVPQWATKGFWVEINGRKQKVDAEPGSYLTLSRKWKDGDVIALRMPFEFHLEPIMDQGNIASLFYGPVLLAAQESAPREEWRKIVLDKNGISNSIEGDPQKLEFRIDGIVFKPFYDTYGRHSVYLDVMLK